MSAAARGGAPAPGTSASGCPRGDVDAEQRGDLVVTGGRLLVDGRAVDGDVLVRGGRIAAVGPRAREGADRSTPWLDAAGGLVSPGFGDAHVHPHHAGLQVLGCDLGGSADASRYLMVIADFAAERPGSGWITGGGWSMEAFPGGVPSARALDEVLPHRPVFLPNSDGHGAWVNSAALRLAGITRDTPDPPDGRIERDGAGEPTGTLHEGAAGLVAAHVPLPSEEEMDAALLAAQARMLAWGVTHWQDAIVGATGAVADPLPSYLRLVASGQLRATVVGALWWDRGRGLEQLPDLTERRERARAAGSRRFSAGTVKIMQDGVAENFTAAMLEPYLDACGCAGTGDGHSFLTPEELTAAVGALHAGGVQVHAHALGDRAVRESLDAIEAAQGAHPGRDLRHHLAHLQVVHPDDVPRFARLGVTANIQPLWAAHEPQMDELTIPFLGQRRASWQYPFADLAAAGATLAAGSDWPVSTADVLQCLHVAVNRRTSADEERFLPHQRLSLDQALTAVTAGVAHVNHDEARTGRLVPGLDGDLTVLDRDLLAHPPDEIDAARVTATVIAGQVLHDASATPADGRTLAGSPR